MRKQLLCLMMVVAAGCADQPASAPTASTSEAPASVDGNTVTLAKFTCPGMTWGGCRATVTKALQALPGVANVEIDAATFSATVSGDAEAFVVEDAVAALETSGFPAETTEELTGS